MEFIIVTGPAATQNTGLHCSLLYDCIVFSCCLLYFILMLFVLFALSFVIFNLRATIILNLNLNLKSLITAGMADCGVATAENFSTSSNASPVRKVSLSVDGSGPLTSTNCPL